MRVRECPLLWGTSGVQISVHLVPHSFPDLAGWRQCWHRQHLCVGITCLSLQCPPRDSCFMRAVSHHLTGTVRAALWMCLFINLFCLKGCLQISLGTQQGSAWLCLLQDFYDEPVLLTRRSCKAADNVYCLCEMTNTE